MRTLAVRSIRANPVRFVATVLAVMFSTGFLAGTLILRDSLGASLEASARNQLLGVDAAVLNEGSAPTGSATGGTPGEPGGSVPSGTVPGGPGAAPATTTTTTAPGATGPAEGAPSTTAVVAPTTATPPTSSGAAGLSATGDDAQAPPAGPTGAGARADGGESAQGPTTTAARRRESNNGPEGNSVAGRSRQLGVNQNVPASLLPTIRQAPGADEVAGILSGFVSVLDGRGGAVVENVNGSLWLAPEKLNAYRIVDGRAPTATGEVAIDARTVEQGNLALGGTVQLATNSGPREATLVGVANYGDQPNSGTGDVLVSEADGFAWLADGKQEYAAVYVTAEDGTTPAELVGQLQGAVPAGYSVETGDTLRDTASSGIGTVVNVISGALVGFALVALFVALFTIYNTFSIIVSQRTREFALLRALGASGTQVRKSVRSEALLLGLLSSVIGFLLGIVLFTLLTRFVAQFRDIAGTVTMRITPFSVLVVLVIGVVVTFLSAFVPAWRASSTKPVEAMRTVAVDRSGSNRTLGVIGLVCLVLGVVILLVGAFSGQFLLMAFGPPVLFLGVLVGGPVLAGAFGRLVRAVVSPFSKGTLRVGVENVQRNPRRSAATALALVIGVFLVVLVTAGGGAVRDYAVNQLAEFGGSDLTIIAFSGELPDDYVRQVRGVQGVGAVAEVYPNVGELPEGLPLSAVDYKEVAGLGLAFDAGDGAKLGKDDVVLPSFLATSGGRALEVGDPVEVAFNTGETRTLRLGGITKPAFPPSAYVSLETAREADPAIVPVIVQVTAQPGQVRAVTDSVTGISRQYAGIDVASGNFFAQTIKNFFNFVITAANGLLTVAVVIALFGIVNTLVLSVTERTREIGLLRAVGMTRRQVRATIRLESISVSLLGALVGTVFGLFVAWCLTRPILNQEGEAATGFSWPVSQLILIAVLSLVVGVGAAIVPARRAARLNIIEAVTVD